MMKGLCTRVERTMRSGRECLQVTVSLEEEAKAFRSIPTDDTALEKIKCKLSDWGLKLGGTLPAASAPTNTKYPEGPVTILVDSQPAKRTVVADELEILELSTGGVVCWLYVFDVKENLLWMIGKSVELTKDTESGVSDWISTGPTVVRNRA